MSLDPLYCLAEALYFEARNQAVAEQLMVANIIINRVYSDRYPDTICEVVYEKRWSSRYNRWVAQFSYTLDGIPETIHDVLAWDVSVLLASSYINNPIKYFEGCHYHADYVNPSWADTMTGYQFGTHIFYDEGC